jgi:hypothetical protein
MAERTHKIRGFCMRRGKPLHGGSLLVPRDTLDNMRIVVCDHLKACFTMVSIQPLIEIESSCCSPQTTLEL